MKGVYELLDATGGRTAITFEYHVGRAEGRRPSFGTVGPGCQEDA